MPTRKVVFFIRTNTTYLRLSFYIVVSVTTYVHVQVYPRYEEIEGTVAMVVGLSYRKRWVVKGRAIPFGLIITDNSQNCVPSENACGPGWRAHADACKTRESTYTRAERSILRGGHGGTPGVFSFFLSPSFSLSFGLRAYFTGFLWYNVPAPSSSPKFIGLRDFIVA